MQAERTNIHKNDRFIYLIHYTSLAQDRLKAKCWIVDDKVATDFMKKNEKYYGVPTNFVSEWGERRH